MRATIRKSTLEGIILFAVTLVLVLVILAFVAVDVAGAAPEL